MKRLKTILPVLFLLVLISAIPAVAQDQMPCFEGVPMNGDNILLVKANTISREDIYVSYTIEKKDVTAGCNVGGHITIWQAAVPHTQIKSVVFAFIQKTKYDADLSVDDNTFLDMFGLYTGKEVVYSMIQSNDEWLVDGLEIHNGGKHVSTLSTVDPLVTFQFSVIQQENPLPTPAPDPFWNIGTYHV